MRMLPIVVLVAIPITSLSGTQERADSTGRERYTAAAVSGGGPRSNPVAQNVEI